jgi:hypothetical protein
MPGRPEIHHTSLVDEQKRNTRRLVTPYDPPMDRGYRKGLFVVTQTVLKHLGSFARRCHAYRRILEFTLHKPRNVLTNHRRDLCLARTAGSGDNTEPVSHTILSGM